MANEIQIQVIENSIVATKEINTLVVETNKNIVEVSNKDGRDGKSAYRSAVDAGFIGSDEEFNKSLTKVNEFEKYIPLIYAGL